MSTARGPRRVTSSLSHDERARATSAIVNVSCAGAFSGRFGGKEFLASVYGLV